MKFQLTLLLVAFSTACNGGGASDDMDVSGGDMAVPSAPDMAVAGRDPKEHPPQAIINNNGGRVLRNPELITIVWSGDSLATKRQQFAEWIATGDYLSNLAEYGVGPGTVQPLVTVTDPPPSTFDKSAAGPMLRAMFAAGTLPPPTKNSLYLIYLPHGTIATMDGGSGCDNGTGGWLGYHAQTLTNLPQPAPAHVPFAIMPACHTGNAEFYDDTTTASHEIAEAATDPEGTGWINDSQPLSEVGDLCDPLSYTAAVMLPGGISTQYSVMRVWSAAAAAAGTSDPCLPVPPAPYVWFNAGITPYPIVITTDASGKGSATFQVEPFAMGNVGVISWYLNSGPASGVRFSATQGKGSPGSTQTVTISVTGAAQPNNYPLSLIAQAGQYQNAWWTYFTIN